MLDAIAGTHDMSKWLQVRIPGQKKLSSLMHRQSSIRELGPPVNKLHVGDPGRQAAKQHEKNVAAPLYQHPTSCVKPRKKKKKKKKKRKKKKKTKA